MPILVGTDGVRRMGKSLGNYIGVAESAENQFGKIMSIPDEPMRQYFTLLTDLPLAEVDRLLGPGVNPRDAKEVLGKAIVAQYHGAEAAETRPLRVPPPGRRRRPRRDPRGQPRRRQARRRGPDCRPSSSIKELGLESSTSNARRVIEQGGVNIGPDRDASRSPIPSP